ncbi:MAG: SIMPL domain-containing protein [Candidatus Sungbacteria bacterium]|uniref:SIMPL domain-containing protein n=1 Tax=Candidatus Sungiibacteriota bacterium TaxID=2750080 RepID=A0A932R0F7_9BACT|nr:SIMPL domain-containing protein [Candidatus Sungbacteria bacterium]
MRSMYQDFSSSVRSYVRGLFVLFLAGLTASSFAFAWYYASSARDIGFNQVPARQISVSGEGKVAVRPDMATISASIVSQAGKVGAAQDENSKRSDAVIAFLKNRGIADRDIKTVGYVVTPQYDYSRPCLEPFGGDAIRCPPSGAPGIVSYEVRHSVEIKIRDLAKTDAVVEGAVAHGANQVDSVQFGVDDKEGIKAQARREAIDNAQNRAEILARDLGVRLKRIVGFYESGEGGPVFAQALKDGGGEVTVPSAPRIVPGEQEVRSSVTITYEFR